MSESYKSTKRIVLNDRSTSTRNPSQFKNQQISLNYDMIFSQDSKFLDQRVIMKVKKDIKTPNSQISYENNIKQPRSQKSIDKIDSSKDFSIKSSLINNQQIQKNNILKQKNENNQQVKQDLLINNNKFQDKIKKEKNISNLSFDLNSSKQKQTKRLLSLPHLIQNKSLNNFIIPVLPSFLLKQ